MAVIDSGSSTSGKANVDANYNLQVNLPATASQAGYVQHAFVPTSTITKITRTSTDNAQYCAELRQIIDVDFNSASTTWAAKIGTNATTMTKSVQSGAMRLNNGASVTAAQGISIYTNRTVNIETGYDYRVRCYIKHGNGEVANKQMEFGLGYYNFAAGQANAMNEFIGFRWSTAGNLLGVVSTAGTEQTTNVNGGTVFSNNVTREYEIIISESKVEFWVAGTYYSTLDRATDVYGLLRGVSLPVVARVFNSGTPSAAPTMDITNLSVLKIGPDDGAPFPYRMSSMGKSSYYYQPDLTTAATATHNMPGTGTAPTAATGSNTASVLNTLANMGGFYRMNGASFNVAAHNNVIIAGYQNPAVPTATGVATNSRNFYVTSITVSAQIISTGLTGGPYTAIWFAAIGATALSLATTDADGTTAVAQKAPRFVPLSRVTSFAAAAALGVIETGAGDFSVYFNTPLVVHPGEVLHIGQRLITVTAVTAGTIDGAISVNGYWD